MVKAYVEVSELMDHFKENNLVIVHKDELRIEEKSSARKLRMLQEKLLKQDALTFRQVMDAKLTTYTTPHGLRGSSYIKPNEIFKNKVRIHFWCCTNYHIDFSLRSVTK